jgi:hypothetical protein
MASNRHNFIVASIVRKIKQYGFQIIFFEGAYQDIATDKYDLPPKIISHRPDAIGEKAGKIFCIGEAKNENDIFSERTRTQIKDFFEFVKLQPENKLILGIPLNSKNDLEGLLKRFGLLNNTQIEVLYIPEQLFPYETKI